MTGTIWNRSDREHALQRFGRLMPEARPKWGSLTAPRMVVHVTDALRAGLGEVTITPVAGPLKYWPINTLVMFYLPWPKSAPTAPELLTRAPTGWSGDLHGLRDSLDRFVARDINGPWPRHAAFGDIGGAGWGRLMYRHFDHHLTQFGV